MNTTSPSLLMRVRTPEDRAAWAEFDRRYREWLLRFFRRRNVPAADSEDLTQRVFEGLARSLPQFTYDPQRGRFRDYLFRAAKNAIIEWARCPDQRRGDVLLGGRDDSLIAEDDPAAAQVWEEEWVNHHYRLAMESLRQSGSERDIAILERSMSGASIADLCQEFGLETEAAYKARQRIRDRMETLIAAQIAEEDRTDA